MITTAECITVEGIFIRESRNSCQFQWKCAERAEHSPIMVPPALPWFAWTCFSLKEDAYQKNMTAVSSMLPMKSVPAPRTSERCCVQYDSCKLLTFEADRQPAIYAVASRSDPSTMLLSLAWKGFVEISVDANAVVL